jgi:hypothetical protein
MPRLRGRSMLRSAGMAFGALGLAAALEACGVKAPQTATGGASRLPNAGTGTADWWARQRLQAKQVLLHPADWAKQALHTVYREVQLPRPTPPTHRGWSRASDRRHCSGSTTSTRARKN